MLVIQHPQHHSGGQKRTSCCEEASVLAEPVIGDLSDPFKKHHGFTGFQGPRDRLMTQKHIHELQICIHELQKGLLNSLVSVQEASPDKCSFLMYFIKVSRGARGLDLQLRSMGTAFAEDQSSIHHVGTW